jgi:uncharacterized PurR-regulated membrane protein YhhQ (DUF165 family)
MIRRVSIPAAAAFAGYVLSVWLANWLTSRYGLVPAGFGLMVTAGTYSAGCSLALRDAVQDTGGTMAVLLGIATGAVVSTFGGASHRIVVASVCAFLLGELLDFAVYTRIKRRSWRAAVITSNTLGALVDTLVFLHIAGFPITGRTVAGQMLVKAVWVTAAYLAIGEVIRRAVSR